MEDLDYLRTEYKSVVLDKNELLKTLNLISKVAHINSSSIECNSLTFIPNPNTKTLTLAVTNDLTYFNSKVELLGEKEKCLNKAFSIKVETLNKLKPYFKEKILIFMKENEYYIRLIDGDLLLDTKIPDLTRLSFTTSINKLILEIPIKSFSDTLNFYKKVADDYSDKWISFDGERISLCGLNFYSETKVITPRMCMLISDVDLLTRLEQYYPEENLKIYSTDSKVPKLHIQVGGIEIEILNVISNINTTNIEKLSKYVSNSTYEVETEALNRVLNMATTLSGMERNCILKIKDESIVIILKHSKGDSEFNLRTQKLSGESEQKEVKLNVNILSKLVSSMNSDRLSLTLNKIYTTIVSDNTKAIILNM